jgi:hypothetical protein
VKPESLLKISAVTGCLVLLAVSGCRKPVPIGALVLMQSPASAAAAPSVDLLDVRYPPGSRVVLVTTAFEPSQVQVLSEGLLAAGDPQVSYDGQRVLFVGKTIAAGDWQIYESSLDNRPCRAVTSISGGAMNPVLLPNGSLVFASPVPKIAGNQSPQPLSALFVQSPGGQPQRLTFSSRSITEPTMLFDGRILFISALPPEVSNDASSPALFTINNDGTEVTAFAGMPDPGLRIERPRQLADGRLVCLVSKRDTPLPGGVPECVRMARPFASREPLLANLTAYVRSVQPTSNNDLLVCAENSSDARASLALFRVKPAATQLGTPLFADPAWDIGEAAEVSPRRQPMGRLSSMDPTKSSGQILCLNANYTSEVTANTIPPSPAARVRVLAETVPGKVDVLGEAPVQADGSFMAEVPANIPLGFETLDAHGEVLRRDVPMLWVRPGENRSCVGCHEPRNRSPHNRRPLAVNVPVPRLGLANAQLAQQKADW